MQQITIAGSVAGSAAPTLESLEYDKRLGANPYVTDWFSAKLAKMTVVNPAANGGTVTSIASRRVGSTALLVANPPTTQRPNHSVSDANFKGRGSITHDNGGSGDVLSYTGTFPVGGDFFKVAVVNFAGAPAGTMYPGMSSVTTGNRHLFTANSTNFLFRVGPAGATEAQAARPFRLGTTCLIGCWNAALKRARLSIDFGETWGTDIKAGTVVDVTTAQVGHSSNLSWCDHLFGPLDLSDGSEDAKALLADIRGYATEFLLP